MDPRLLKYLLPHHTGYLALIYFLSLLALISSAIELHDHFTKHRSTHPHCSTL
jgi:hypothetical protein